MARDRFVCFKEKVPTEDQLKMILEDYLGGLGTPKYDPNYWYVLLPGKPSFPFTRLMASETGMWHDERWFEVYVGQLNLAPTFNEIRNKKGEEITMGLNIDVITRQQDELTNVIADGYANLLARYFDADIA